MRERDGIPGRRTNARLALILVLAWSVAGTAQAAFAKTPAGAPERIVFPVVGKVAYEDDFGDPRGARSHQGNDILADRKAPAVAAEAGTITFWTSSASAGCMLYLHGKSGATYLYIHLNNDLTDANDNRGKCKPGVSYAPGLEDGQKVRAGQLVGYVGDSGDANGLHPHLHFELHPADGDAVSPYRWLRRAEKLLFALPEGDAERMTAETPALVLSGTVRVVAPGEDGGSLTIRVATVRLSTGGRWEVTRNVTLSVPADAVFEDTGGGAPALADLAKGTKVTVWTSPIELALETQLARPGVLAAARVAVRS